jgi:hypothetical protein
MPDGRIVTCHPVRVNTPDENPTAGAQSWGASGPARTCAGASHGAPPCCSKARPGEAWRWYLTRRLTRRLTHDLTPAKEGCEVGANEAGWVRGERITRQRPKVQLERVLRLAPWPGRRGPDAQHLAHPGTAVSGSSLEGSDRHPLFVNPTDLVPELFAGTLHVSSEAAGSFGELRDSFCADIVQRGHSPAGVTCIP